MQFTIYDRRMDQGWTARRSRASRRGGQNGRVIGGYATNQIWSSVVLSGY